MLRLSDPNYFLPLIHPFSPGKILSTGSTQPMIVRGVCEQTGVKDDYVIKFRAAPRMSAEASCRELVAALLARELGFTVPEPALIYVSREFLPAMLGNENYAIAANSVGLNYGTRLEQGYQLPLADQKLSPALTAKLTDLFAYDILIGNADRRLMKPNFLTNGHDILVFDHELAFAFLMELPFLRNPNPWLIRDIDLTWIRDNYCFNLLHGRSVDFLNFIARLDVLNESFWAKMFGIIPDEWQNDQTHSIKSYLDNIIHNKEKFAAELNRILL